MAGTPAIEAARAAPIVPLLKVFVDQAHCFIWTFHKVRSSITYLLKAKAEDVLRPLCLTSVCNRADLLVQGHTNWVQIGPSLFVQGTSCAEQCCCSSPVYRLEVSKAFLKIPSSHAYRTLQFHRESDTPCPVTSTIFGFSVVKRYITKYSQSTISGCSGLLPGRLSIQAAYGGSPRMIE